MIEYVPCAVGDDEHWALLALRSLIDWESCGFTIIGEEENGERRPPDAGNRSSRNW